ncbi:MAG: roadblock/LC7 domain-containing protein [Polyangiales bacterium]
MSQTTYKRVEHETGFTAILSRHVAATPGAYGAALVDAEGEAVDYAGNTIDPFELKVAAAHWRIVLADIDKGKHGEMFGQTRRLFVHTDLKAFVLDALPEGYALLSILDAKASFGHADRALDATLRDLYREAGWQAPPGAFRWHPLDVELDARGRPLRVRVRKQWADVTSMGRIIAGLQPGELGFRVAVPIADIELTLVRGRDERWYGDLPLEGDERDPD